jgi:hypothetical protein
VARAKRTARADARRRYRQTIGGDPEEFEVDEPATTAATPAGGSATRRPSPGAPGRQLGFADAMRAAYHPPHVREDIAALPSLMRTRWFLIPLGLVLVGIAGVLVLPTNYVSGLFFQLMVLPPAMAPVFIVGFFAKRASYLLGLIISVVDVIGYVAFIYLSLPVLAAGTTQTQSSESLIFSALAIGPLSGIFFAAGAAWYRRFLAFSSRPRAGQRPSQRSGQQRSKANRPARG